jgi:hypothetical protein
LYIKNRTIDNVQKVNNYMEKMLCMSVGESEEAASSSTDSEILPQLKDKLEIQETKRSEQAHILAVLPQSWNVREIEFGASNYMVRKPKGIQCRI